MDIYTADFKRETITLRDLCNSSLDINCDVEIYDCTSDVEGEWVSWDDLPGPTISCYGQDIGRYAKSAFGILDATVRYMTINQATHSIVIEVVDDYTDGRAI